MHPFAPAMKPALSEAAVMVPDSEMCSVRYPVPDAGTGFAPAGRGRELDEPGGWGLVLVDRLAASWGVECDERTRVWFELAAAAA